MPNPTKPNVQSLCIAVIADPSNVPRGPGIAGSPDHLIRPGIGAGGVRIGMTEGKTLRVLGAPDSREDHNGIIEIIWPGIAVRAIAGPGGRGTEGLVTDHGIRTAEGIGVGSTVAEVKATVDHPECEPGHIIRLGSDTPPGDRVTTFQLSRTRMVTATEVSPTRGQSPGGVSPRVGSVAVTNVHARGWVAVGCCLRCPMPRLHGGICPRQTAWARKT